MDSKTKEPARRATVFVAGPRISGRLGRADAHIGPGEAGGREHDGARREHNPGEPGGQAGRDEPSRPEGGDVVTVDQAMTGRPISIAPDAPIETAMSVMRERRIRHLPVVDDAGRLVGVISDRDVRSVILAPEIDQFLAAETRRHLVDAGTTLRDVPVNRIMTSPVITTTPQAPLAQAAAIMHERRIGCLPVLSGGRLIGIVTDRDVLKGLAATLPAIRGLDPDSYLP